MPPKPMSAAITVNTRTIPAVLYIIINRCNNCTHPVFVALEQCLPNDKVKHQKLQKRLVCFSLQALEDKPTNMRQHFSHTPYFSTNAETIRYPSKAPEPVAIISIYQLRTDPSSCKPSGRCYPDSQTKPAGKASPAFT